MLSTGWVIGGALLIVGVPVLVGTVRDLVRDRLRVPPALEGLELAVWRERPGERVLEFCGELDDDELAEPLTLHYLAGRGLTLRLPRS